VNDDASVFVELLCDHPGCASKNPRVLKTACDITEAHSMAIGGQVRCPVHGVRTDPVVVDRARRLEW
jgi:hypothetical protein